MFAGFIPKLYKRDSMKSSISSASIDAIPSSLTITTLPKFVFANNSSDKLLSPPSPGSLSFPSPLRSLSLSMSPWLPSPPSSPSSSPSLSPPSSSSVSVLPAGGITGIPLSSPVSTSPEGSALGSAGSTILSDSMVLSNFVACLTILSKTALLRSACSLFILSMLSPRFLTNLSTVSTVVL